MSSDSTQISVILYIHGFNSSPLSHKARAFSAWSEQYDEVQVLVPELSFDPSVAITQLQTLIEENLDTMVLLVGSSLGGYYATYLSEKYGIKAVLVNPAVSPHKTLGEEFLGPQKNYYSGKEYILTMEHVNYLATLDVNSLQSPANYFLLVQTGDEVLDYRLAVTKFQGARQEIQQNGSHSFDNFEAVIPAMFEFAGIIINQN